MHWYAHYTGDSLGRVLHFLNVYGGLRLAENAIIGNGTVTLYNKPVATFTIQTIEIEGLGGWKFTSKFVPVFIFSTEYKDLIEKQDRLQRVAILESAVYEVEDEIVVLKYELSKPKMLLNLYFPVDSTPQCIEAKAEIVKIEEEIARQEARLVEAKLHELDYSEIG
jgi:hypothetical protein